MKTISCLVLAVVSLSMKAQTVRLVGTTDGGFNYFKINSDGSGFEEELAFPSEESFVSLMEASNLYIYGAAASSQGTLGYIFRMYADGRNLEVMHEFEPFSEGLQPSAALIEASDGNLYGTLAASNITGNPGYGATIYKIDPDGSNFTILKQLNGTTEGNFITHKLLEASDGLLYGVTLEGGANDKGVMFRIGKDGSNFEVIHDFQTSTGEYPKSALIEYNQQIIGTTFTGGNATYNGGVIFNYELEFDNYFVLHEFNPSVGSRVNSDIFQDGSKLYGTTSIGGASSVGTVFSFDLLGNSLTTLHEFSSATGNRGPMMKASDGNLYGTTFSGGTESLGSIFKVDLSTATPTFSEIFSFDGTNGESPSYFGALVEIINTPPIVNVPINDRNEDEDTESETISIANVFDATDEPLSYLTPSVESISNPNLFTSISIDQGNLLMDFEPNAHGTSEIVLRATDSRGDYVESSFNITLNPIADTPSITDAETIKNQFNESGLVVSRNAADGTEVTHFKVTNITGGTLFLNDESTAISVGDFVAFSDGELGLKFNGSVVGSASFDIQASTSDQDSGLGGDIRTATVTVNLPLAASNNSVVLLYPNPVADLLRVKLDQPFLARIYGLNGGIILESSSNQIDVSHLKRGLYFVEVQNEKGDILSVEKIIKKN